MRKFESQVQMIRHKVLKEVIERTVQGNFDTTRHRVPKAVLPGDKPMTRCCVYKEREIVSERVDVAADPIGQSDPIIEIIELACDECPIERFRVTEACRGCLAHRCMQACPRNAIMIVKGKAFIDQEKCVECGRCRDACSYNAISDVMRPCKKSCKAKAIEIQENKKVAINREKCTSCGACVYQCPFGAVNDRSEVVPVVKELEASKASAGRNVYALVAPAISTQYSAGIGKIISAIRKIGFKDVVEVALGADIVAYNEALEFVERVGKKGEACMMSSCCPAFVEHVKKSYGDLFIHVSTMVSPMVAVARYVRKSDPDSVLVFIGPCTAKKEEARQKDISDAVDYVMTFEELEAMFDAYNIVVDECEDESLESASHFGRGFARTGGVRQAVEEVLREEGIDNVTFNPISCSGIDEIDKAIRMLKSGRNTFNFIEGMACPNGCIGGPASLTHELKDQKLIDKYAELAKERNIKDAINDIDLDGIDLHRHF